MSDVISKLISSKPIKSGGDLSWQNDTLGATSGTQPYYVSTFTHLSGLETKLTERFDDINYYSGSGVY